MAKFTPTLTFTRGDLAEIYVHNEMEVGTIFALAWLCFTQQRGWCAVSNQMPIAPHTTHKYSFPVVQSGTHWYHSHSSMQEQIGMYGAF
jgi:FtsP/CotA-like multicopper oxidase with cupredoxin domain